MDSKHVIGLYEAYLDVYSEREYIPEASRSDVSYAREAVSNARKRYKEHPEGHKGDDTAYQYKLAKGAFKSVVNRARQAKNKVEESVDLYDVVLDHLLDEGYCDDVESAEIIMANMSEEWLDEIVEGFVPLSKDKAERVKSHLTTKLVPQMTHHSKELQKNVDEYKKRKRNPLVWHTIGGAGPQKRVKHHLERFKTLKKHSENARDALSQTSAHNVASAMHKRNIVASKLKDLGFDPDATRNPRSSIRKFKRSVNEEVYNLVLDYLLDEGYCDDVDSAEVIMANMSEEWLDEIVEGFVSPYKTKPTYGNPQGTSPAMKAMQKSDELQRTEPGSPRQKMQTRRSQQMNRMFQAARRA